MAKKKKFVKQMGKVAVSLHDLKMLCLNVDYGIGGDVKDEIEDISIKYQKRFSFDTHDFRVDMDDADIDGAIPRGGFIGTGHADD